MAAICVALCGSEAAADEPPRPPDPTVEEPDHDYRVGLFDNLGTNILDSLSGYNLVWFGLSIGSTAALSASGADDAIQRWYWRDNTILGDGVSNVAFVAGWLTPLVIPGALALTGVAIDDSEHASAGVTALQAVAINAVLTQLVKFITGRPLPYENGAPSDDGGPISIERSRSGREWGFVFGGGVGWPSGHTSSHMALASSLVAFYPDKAWLPFVVYPIVGLVGLAMIEGDHHWFSDVVAGGLFGHAVGWTVGSNMRRNYDAARGKRSEAPSGINIRPLVSSNAFMIMLSF